MWVHVFFYSSFVNLELSTRMGTKIIGQEKVNTRLKNAVIEQRVRLHSRNSKVYFRKVLHKK